MTLHDEHQRAVNRLAATLLAAPSLLSLILISHHPVLEAHAAGGMAAAMAASAGMDRFVHGGLIAMLGLQVLGFHLFSAKLGWERPTVTAAFMAYVAGVLFMVIAATLDGFVTPDLVAVACRPGLITCTASDGVFHLVSAMIQDFSKLALVIMSVATACWAAALLARKNRVDQGAAVMAILCAGVPVAILLITGVRLRPGNLVGMIAAQLAWNLLAAMLVIRRGVTLSGVDQQSA